MNRAAESRLRLEKDLQDLKDNPSEYFSAAPSPKNLYLWRGFVRGPVGSPWEGGIFKLTMEFAKDYPYSPPIVKFTTRVFHPNIIAEGTCASVLRDEWASSHTIRSILRLMQIMLDEPNAQSAVNEEAAALCIYDPQEYVRRIKECVSDSLLEIN
jgi:ubiquitin-protein ligase